MTGLRVAWAALHNRNVSAAIGGFAGFSLVEHGTWLALLLYAFDRGGVGEAGIVAFALLVPAALLAPVASALVERLRPERALAIGFGLQAVACFLIAAAMAAGLPLAVYLAASLLSVTIALSRPTLSAALPTIVDGPAELAAANSLAGLIETASSFLGPAATGLVLVAAGPTTAFASAGVVVAAAALSALTIRTGDAGSLDPELQSWEPMEDETVPAREQLAAGVRLLRAEPEPRLLVVLLAAAWIIFGALDVALVAIAVDQMGRSEATAGLLTGALGLGGLLGAGLSLALVGRRRLTLPVAAGLAVLGLSVMALATTSSVVVVIGLLAVAGIGDVIADIAGRTLLQGLAAEDTLARVFGLLEGLATAGLAAGSIGFSVLAVAVGLGPALAIVGAIMPLAVVARWSRLREIDRARPEVDGELLALIRRIPIFAPLPAFRVEQLLANLQPVEAGPDAKLFSRGDRGDVLYLVTGGTAVVELQNRTVEHRRGGFFGEIALIRDQPRMATVRAGPTGLVGYSLGRTVFLDAISAYPRSQARTMREADRRLDEG